MLVDIGHDVFEAIKLFDVPEISSRLISSIERTLFVMMMLFVCGGQSTHGLKCGFRIQGGGRFCIPPLVQIQLYPYKIHPVKHSRNRISVRARPATLHGCTGRQSRQIFQHRRGAGTVELILFVRAN